MNLRKTICLPLAQAEVEILVNFRIIEIAENVYNDGIDMIISRHLVSPAHIKRSLVAAVISQWVVEIPAGMKRSDVYETVLTASPAVFMQYVGAIQGAAAFALGYIDEEALSKLVRGEDLEEPAEEGSNKGVPLGEDAEAS
jgi:hypothetical protein